jgi:hypothetical protein
MPGQVNEALWKRAKRAVVESEGKPESAFGDREWALVQLIYRRLTGER